MATVTGLMDQFRNHEYTGTNRCIPCTVSNVLIATVLSILIGYATVATGSNVLLGGITGGIVLTGSIIAIYLRGYLVPYTPEITKQYFPDRVLRWFDKPTPTTQPAPRDFEEIDVERELHSLGAITECEHRDDLCLDPSFQRRWRDHIDTLRAKDTEAKQADVAELFELGDVDHRIKEYEDSAVVMVGNRQVGQWESDAAFIADLAADKTLREHKDNWLGYHIANRSQLLNSLRMFIEQCPACTGPVSMGQETVESCCRTMDVVAVTCTECDSRLFELELTPDLKQDL